MPTFRIANELLFSGLPKVPTIMRDYIYLKETNIRDKSRIIAIKRQVDVWTSLNHNPSIILLTNMPHTTNIKVFLRKTCIHLVHYSYTADEYVVNIY